MSKNINSHIQMPKCILKKFEDDNHHIYYYDVKTYKIGRSTPKSWNTEFGYYDEGMEEFFSKNIETPFSKVVKYIEENIDNNPFELKSTYVNDVKCYFNSLFARSPKMYQEAKKSFILPQFFTEQYNHRLAVISALNEIEKDKFFDNYFVSFMKNETDIPFVLPIMGMYIYAMKGTGEQRIVLPLTPKIAIILIDKRFKKNYVDANGKIFRLVITDKNIVDNHNCYAIKHQIGLGYGSVISNSKQVLIEINETIL